ncbi:MAG: exo-alpha-sialidase, partial [Planctomycetes bacterium]|nr:exo-alpha-sialidase [Planctomycetota bacterium]
MRVDIDRIGKMWARYSVWLAAAAVLVGWPMNPAWGQFKGDVAALNANAVADSGEDTNLQLATDAAGNWVAVWQSNDTLDDTVGADLDIFVSTSSDGGVTWSDPAALNSAAATDAMDDFVGDYEPSLWNLSDLVGKLENRAAKVIHHLFTVNPAPEGILILTILQPAGRAFVGGFGNPPGKSLRLAMSASDLRSITLVETGDPLGLWKYARSHHQIRQSVKVMATDVLDEYEMYR